MARGHVHRGRGMTAAGLVPRQFGSEQADRKWPSADPVESIKSCGGSSEEISPVRSARASSEQLAGVPVDRIAEAFLVGREVAFKHATPRTEGFNAGLDIGAHRIRHRLRRWRFGLLLESETVDSLAKSADF